jgi:transposase
MKEFNAEKVRFETETAFGTVSALDAIRQAQTCVRYPAYIGLDVHKETIAVAVARAGRDAPEFRGEIANKPKTVARLVERLSQEFNGEVLLFCYEAGPCGYVLYRQILELGHDCQVVAPSLIPKKPGERIKTDRRDAISPHIGPVGIGPLTNCTSEFIKRMLFISYDSSSYNEARCRLVQYAV